MKQLMRDFKPDFNRLKKVLLRDGEPDIVPFYELFADTEIMQAVLGKPVTYSTVIEFQYKMGYDYASAGINFIYPKNLLSTDDTAELSRGKRNFVDDNHGMIEDRKDFDKYPWLKINSSAFYGINETIKYLPDGMKIILSMPGGILENVMWLMGYVPFSYAIHDDEQLIWDIFEKIGSDFVNVLEYCLSNTDISKIGALVMGDDMGYNLYVENY